MLCSLISFSESFFLFPFFCPLTLQILLQRQRMTNALGASAMALALLGITMIAMGTFPVSSRRSPVPPLLLSVFRARCVSQKRDDGAPTTSGDAYVQLTCRNSEFLCPADLLRMSLPSNVIVILGECDFYLDQVSTVCRGMSCWPPRRRSLRWHRSSGNFLCTRF